MKTGREKRSVEISLAAAGIKHWYFHSLKH